MKFQLRLVQLFIVWTIALSFTVRTSLAKSSNQNDFINSIKTTLKCLIDSHYPSLKKASIKIQSFESKKDYLRAYFNLADTFSNPKNRQYIIEYRSSLSSKRPGDLAFTAILAHELAHIVDIIQLSWMDLAFKYFGYWRSKEIQKEIETAADKKVLELGYAQGLIKFREWLYLNSDPKTRAEKEFTYLTPKQIKNWIEKNKFQKNPNRCLFQSNSS